MSLELEQVKNLLKNELVPNAVQAILDIFPETFDNKLAKKNHESSQQEYEPRFKLRRKQFIQV